MNLLAKRIVLLVADGIDERDTAELRRAVEREGAEVFVSTALPQLLIETVTEGKRGKEIFVDMPIELVEAEVFDALLVPDGIESIDFLCASPESLALVREFIALGKSVVFSGAASQLQEEHDLRGETVHRIERGEGMTLCRIIAEGSDYDTSSHLNSLHIPSVRTVNMAKV